MSRLLNKIKLYESSVRIDVTQIGNRIRNNNLPLNENDFKIHKGVTNQIEFSVRNNDRKPINLLEKTLYVTILNPNNGEQMLQKMLFPQDEKKGLAKLIISPEDIVNWDNGFYRFSVIVENNDNTQNILFLDQNQLSSGTIELVNNALPPILQSIELDPQEFTPNGSQFPVNHTTRTYFISSAIKGSSKLNLNNGLHTFTVKGENFKGDFLVEGSLEEEPSTNTVQPNSDWFTIKVIAHDSKIKFDKFTGIEAYNFFSNVNWIRFTYIPHLENQGKLTKIQIIS